VELRELSLVSWRPLKDSWEDLGGGPKAGTSGLASSANRVGLDIVVDP